MVSITLWTTLAAAFVHHPSVPIPASRRRPSVVAAATMSGAASAEAGAPLGDWTPEEDPIYQDDLWIATEQVRYSDGTGADGIAIKSAYKPFEDAGNHSRGILLLHAAAPSEPDLQLLADRLALSCECVALAPLLRGDLQRWPLQRLAHEAWQAAQYLNRACGAETLAVVAVGSTAVSTLSLLAEGALDAHCAIALCPGSGADTGGPPQNPGDTARAARELSTPLLAICATADDRGKAHANALRDSLALNSRLRSDFYVADFEAEAGEFVLRAARGSASTGNKAADKAIALCQSWVDQYCPEGVARAS